VKEPLEADTVERVVMKLEHVAVTARVDRGRWRQRLAEVRDVHLQELPRRGRRMLVPHRLDQRIDRSRRARPDRESGQEPLLLARGDGHDAVRPG
jgi:hypothetical protein